MYIPIFHKIVLLEIVLESLHFFEMLIRDNLGIIGTHSWVG